MANFASGRMLCGLPLVALAGCVMLETAADADHPPPPGVPAQIAATWQNHVVYSPDPTRGGAPGHGLAGRVYLFGPKMGYPMMGDGSLMVDLLDETSGKAVWLERWKFDPETLKQLARRDIIGWGYTLFLPSARLKPEMTQLRLRTCYRSAKGAQQYTESVVTLAEENGVVHKTTSVSTLPQPLPGRLPAAAPTREPAGPRMPTPAGG